MTHNEIKYLKSLSFKKYRNQHKKFFIEGKRIVDELIQSNYKIDKIIITQDFIDKHSEHTLFSSKLDSSNSSVKFFTICLALFLAKD